MEIVEAVVKFLKDGEISTVGPVAVVVLCLSAMGRQALTRIAERLEALEEKAEELEEWKNKADVANAVRDHQLKQFGSPPGNGQVGVK